MSTKATELRKGNVILKGEDLLLITEYSHATPGNLRADYVLPRKQLQITDAGVFWPLSTDPLFPLVGTWPFPSSDHRLVWVDVRVPSN